MYLFLALLYSCKYLDCQYHWFISFYCHVLSSKHKVTYLLMIMGAIWCNPSNQIFRTLQSKTDEIDSVQREKFHPCLT